jgi:hypothetical protein
MLFHNHLVKKGLKMSEIGESGRWWENYLVRYLMPSIAGVAIVAWLLHTEPQMRAILFFGEKPASLDTPTLTLLILYGNLFCYIASYPILCFHSTRVIDFKEYKWKHSWLDGYIMSGTIASLYFISAYFLPAYKGLFSIFLLTFVFSAIQLFRFSRVLSTATRFRRFSPNTSLAFAYATILALRRSITLERKSSENTRSNDDQLSVHKLLAVSANQTDTRDTFFQESRKHRDFIDTYRHLREHGNSAFIFILELTLATAISGIIKCFPGNPIMSLSLISILLVIWSFPSMLVHLLAQHLENRFSAYERWIDRASRDQD